MTSSDNEQGADDLIREENAEPTLLERTIVLDETEETAHLTGTEEDLERGEAQDGVGCDEGAQDGGADRQLLFPDDSFNISYPLIVPEEQVEPTTLQDDAVPMELPQAVVENLPVRTQPLVSNLVTLQDPQQRRRVNLIELSDPLVGTKKVATTLIQEEFFGVYCLISRSELKQYKNRCYIGYTVDPNRRIRQHNAGKQRGGAQKTDNKGPWDMVCIVHGFPNAVSALRFEWAWQNPEKSRRLREMCDLKKTRKESPFQFRLRIVGKMLNSDPWRRLSLTVRWLIPECEIPFPLDVRPPFHMRKELGKVEKSNIVVPAEVNEYTMLKPCYLCQSTITAIKHLLRCPLLERCGAHFHARCLAEDALRASGEVDVHLVPLTLNCPSCTAECAWSDLVRDQHNLLLVDASKPKHEGVPIAGGMVPIKMVKK